MQGCGRASCGAWALLTAPLCPQRPTDEEGFLQPPGERSSENYQIVKGVSGWLSGGGSKAICPGGPCGLLLLLLPLCWPVRHLPAFAER